MADSRTGLDDPVMKGVVMVNNTKTAINIDKDPNFDDMHLIFDGVEWPDPQPKPYVLETGKRVHVGSTYGEDMGLLIDGRAMELAVGPNEITDSSVWTVVSDDGDNDVIYSVQDRAAVSMTMSWADKNTVLMINNAKGAIKINRDPNFDDMELIFNGVTSMGAYLLEVGEQVHVGSTYGNDMGLVITYDDQGRYMTLHAGPDDVTDAQVWNLMSDSGSDGSGPLAYCLSDLTHYSMTMSWHDKS